MRTAGVCIPNGLHAPADPTRSWTFLVACSTTSSTRFRADPEGAKKYLAIGEHKTDGNLDPAVLAAATAVASAILNLDAAIVLR